MLADELRRASVETTGSQFGFVKEEILLSMRSLVTRGFLVIRTVKSTDAKVMDNIQVIFEFCLRLDQYLGLAPCVARASATRLAIHDFLRLAPKTVAKWI